MDGTKDSKPSISVINLENFKFAHMSSEKRVIESIYESFSTSGVLYVTNYGITPSTTTKLYELCQEFFTLPHHEKMKVHKKNSESGNQGYQYFLQGRTTDPAQVDIPAMFEMINDKAANEDYRKSPRNIKNQWPEYPPEFQNYLQEYCTAMLEFSVKFSKLIASSLKTCTEIMEEIMDPASGLTSLYYPPYEPGSKDGKQLHTDYSLFTVLTQLSPTPGLEVKNLETTIPSSSSSTDNENKGETDNFIAIPPIPQTLVVNAGDFLQRISNNLYKSPPHRVVNRASVPRYSIAYFMDVRPDALVETLRSCVGVDRPSGYSSVVAGDLQPKLRGLGVDQYDWV